MGQAGYRLPIVFGLFVCAWPAFTIAGTIEPMPKAWRARVALHDAQGRELGQREVLGRSPTCRTPNSREPGTWWAAASWDLCFDDFPDPSMAGTQLCAVTLVNDAAMIDARDGTPARAGVLLPPTHGVGYLLQSYCVSITLT